MEKWLKCNSCFSGMDVNSPSSPFWLTSCGHIFCKLCHVSGGNKCSYCKVGNISTVPLTKSAKPEVKSIFKPLEDNFEKLHLAYSFQNSQAKIVLDRLLEVERKYNLLKGEYLQLYEENKSLRENLNIANKQCFIPKASQGTEAKTLNVIPGNVAEKRNGTRHIVFYTTPYPRVPVQNNVQENGLDLQTPANQRLQTLKLAPAKIKMLKARKRIAPCNQEFKVRNESKH